MTEPPDVVVGLLGTTTGGGLLKVSGRGVEEAEKPVDTVFE
jgi:hypothetical protein